MRFQHVIEAVYFRPWLITETGWMAIDRLVTAHLLDREGIRAARPAEDFFGESLPKMEIRNGIAVIPVYGTIGAGFSNFEKSCGAVDTQDITEELSAAVANPAVRRIVLDMNSPGGTVGGIEEVAQAVKDANAIKQVDSFTGPGAMNCSAAQWLSAAVRNAYVAPSAIVGSIGVFIPEVDRSEAFKAMGVNVSLIKAGKYKGMGYPGTKLTQEQRDYLQAEVDATHAQFKAWVKEHRERVPDDAMEGQTFSGRQAAEIGLATGLRNSMAEVLVR